MLPIITIALAMVVVMIGSATRVLVRDRWHHRLVRSMSIALCERYRGRSPMLVCARLSRMWAAIISVSPIPVSASTSINTAEQRMVEYCIRSAARGKPWLEVTLRGLHGQEGGWIGAEVRNRDGSHDFGPLQVNNWWVPRIARLLGRQPSEIRSRLRDDACFNVEAARWIFLHDLARTGDFWRAVGSYHSPAVAKQTWYATAVYRRISSFLPYVKTR